MSTTNHSHLTYSSHSAITSNSSYGSSCINPAALNSTVPNGFDLENFTIKRLIAESEFKVYLIQSKQTKEEFALKVYPYEDGRPSQSFLTELQFIELSHCNLIKIKAFCTSYTLNSEDGPTKISYIVQEYAENGDLYNLVSSNSTVLDEKLIRSYFHQLIAGLEYLHDNNLAHLDIKLENLLLDKNYQLQIIDFDLSKPADGSINEVWGSPEYRAPELQVGLSDNLKEADIYSAAVVLFTMMSGGSFPFMENCPCRCQENYCEGADKEEKMDNFWNYHTEDTAQVFGQDFKELFVSMVDSDPTKRPTIQQIKDSVWYNKEVYTRSELVPEMNKLFFDY